MLQEVVLPRLGQTVEKAIIENWHVKEGDAVKKGDVLLEITTDKATLEVESFAEGSVLKILAKPGDEVEVDAVIAYIGDPKTDKAPEKTKDESGKQKNESVPSTSLGAGLHPRPTDGGQASSLILHPSEHPSSLTPPGKLLISPRAKKLAEQEKVTPLAIRGTGPGGRIVESDVIGYAEKVALLKVSPTAKEIAYQRGVDLLGVKGTGPGGRIMKEDVEHAPSGKPAAGKRVELTPARRIIAERMSKSKREAPHFYLQTDIDMTKAVALREQLKAAGIKVSFNDIIIKAVTRGFETTPMMNASWTDGCIAVNSSVDVALAVSLDDGLMVPVVRAAERLGLEQIAAQTATLIEKARTKRLAPMDYEGGSITVSNLGMHGVGNFLPIINPGQASILGVGEIAEKPVIISGGIAIRKMMSVTLAIDHRVVDGATAAAFLKVVKDALESPEDHIEKLKVG